MGNPALTHTELTRQLQALGIGRSARLVVHSSLRSLGPVTGGPAAVVQAVLDAIGSDGLLVVPTFTYNTAVFDPATTPGRTGVLTETVRNWPGAVRSWHPTHSVAAVGAGAAALCADHHRRGGLGIDSPLDRLAKENGLVLLLGVGQTSNSTVHVGEAHARAPYLDLPFDPQWPREARVLTPDPVTVAIQDPPGCSRAFGALEQELRQRSAIRDGRAGQALVQVMRGQDVNEATMALLAFDPAALLCTDPACYRCARARCRLNAYSNPPA